MRFSELIRSLDWVALSACCLLFLIGLAMLFSTSYATPALVSSRFFRQFIAIILGIVVGGIVAKIPYHAFRRVAPVLYGVGIMGLLVVTVSASIIRGAASRLTIGGFQIQPSEFMKVALIIMLAYLYSRWGRLTGSFFALSLVAVALPVALIVMEPDTGMAALLIAVWGSILVFGGLRWSVVGGMVMIAVVAVIIAWYTFFAPYQKLRILTFLDPSRDPLGAGYNVTQSIIALGSGGVLGRGLGHGPQSQLRFLPELETDFIFAGIGEELGFVGVALVIGLYTILLWRIARTARMTNDPFGKILAVGTFFVLLIGFIVSTGMNMGLLPVTGIPLPLVSYGGSNIISTFVLLGLVQSVYAHSTWVRAAPGEISHVS